jgi:hypothetical protein
MRKEGQELLTIFHPVPADGAVAKSRQGDFAVAGYIGAKGRDPGKDFPFSPPISIIKAQRPICPEEKSLPIGGYGQAAGKFTRHKF